MERDLLSIQGRSLHGCSFPTFNGPKIGSAVFPGKLFIAEYFRWKTISPSLTWLTKVLQVVILRGMQRLFEFFLKMGIWLDVLNHMPKTWGCMDKELDASGILLFLLRHGSGLTSTFVNRLLISHITPFLVIWLLMHDNVLSDAHIKTNWRMHRSVSSLYFNRIFVMTSLIEYISQCDVDSQVSFLCYIPWTVRSVTLCWSIETGWSQVLGFSCVMESNRWSMVLLSSYGVWCYFVPM